MTPDELIADFVARTSTELASHGFPAMPARVIMALTASETGQLTAEELAGQLSASPAAISGAVRYLSTLGFLRQTTVPGSRRHVYTLPPTPWYTATLARPRLYGDIAHLLASGSDLPFAPAARERIEEMVHFFHFIERRMPELLEEWKAERQGRHPAASPPPS